ncbi:MAG: LytTR family DNA-binding domain-containing protein [Eubacteriales bacterium]|nr:LytTR family DNA-binding domain-containing protein [Eubacteriales bacterium]
MNEEREYVWEFKGKLIHLYERDIYYVHLEQRHIYVHTRSRSYQIGRKIQEEEEYLRDMPVIRTHYSYLIHMRYLEALSSTEAILRNGERVPVSASRRRQVHETVKHYFYQVKNVQKCRKTARKPHKTAELL